MTKETRQSPGSWWQTFPGILTAIAGLVTALAGLLVVLHQVGLLGSSAQQPATSSAPGNRAAAAADPGAASRQPALNAPDASPLAQAPGTPAAAGAGAHSVAFPKGAEVSFRVAGNEAIYSVLKATARHRNADTIGLTFSVRVTNKGSYDTLMGNSQFRLLVDGVPRAPVSFYSELVPSRSAKEGEFEFDVPVAARQLVLVVNNGQDTADIPLILETSR